MVMVMVVVVVVVVVVVMIMVMIMLVLRVVGRDLLDGGRHLGERRVRACRGSDIQTRKVASIVKRGSSPLEACVMETVE